MMYLYFTLTQLAYSSLPQDKTSFFVRKNILLQPDTIHNDCIEMENFVGQNLVSDIGMGTLTIRSPIAADIYVDHKIVGQVTNGTLELSVESGEHIIRVSTDNYTPFVRRITVQATQNVNLIAEFISSNGSVEFQSPIRGSVVIIDDQEPMTLPIRMEDIAAGTHTYIVTAPTFEPQEGTFNFEVGKNLYFFSKLESSSGRAIVESRPRDANIYFNKYAFESTEMIGTTPYSTMGLEPDLYSILIEKKGYAAVIREMDTSLGNKGVVKASLPKSGTKLRIKSNIPGARVFVKGMEMGTGKNVSLPKLENGAYEISIRDENSKPVYSQITLDESGDKIIKVNLESKDSALASTYKVLPPLYKRWYIWTSIIGIAATSGTGGYIYYLSTIPEPQEVGDIKVPIP
jgi:hypothetical protein